MQNPKIVVENPVAAQNASRRTLTVDKTDLEWAAGEGLISQNQISQLWDALLKRHSDRPQFDLAHLLYYAGAVLVLVAMGWFGAEMAAIYGAGAVLATSIGYGAAFLFGGQRLWYGQNLRVPGGLLVTLAVVMAPLATASLLDVLGYSVYNAQVVNNGKLFLLEGVTIAAALLALRFFKFPFLVAPIAAALWMMSLTAADSLFPGATFFGNWNQQLAVTLAFGVAMTATGLAVDGKRTGDYSFWLYLFGVSAFWFSLTFLDNGSELGKFVYFAINLGLMFASVLLARRVFLVYGSLGVLWYVSYLTYTLFAGSILFPLALTAIGVGVIFAGIKYHKNRAAIDGLVLSLTPDWLRARLPGRD
ncbi:MAG: DUF2157 domain-containing protein [Leptolyngbya sp.]|nr:DUF2157 domain-containing protein [Candidatus Melainabacteria bacterium]